jgi:hypothetical protein
VVVAAVLAVDADLGTLNAEVVLVGDSVVDVAPGVARTVSIPTADLVHDLGGGCDTVIVVPAVCMDANAGLSVAAPTVLAGQQQPIVVAIPANKVRF